MPTDLIVRITRMEKTCIYYKDGYKYQLSDNYELKIPITLESAIDTDYVKLSVEGLLWLKRGYAWDGPSGPTFDTKSFMRASLIHDALYQLMREGHLDPLKYRNRADVIMQEICRIDGMSWIRSVWVYYGVHWFAAGATLKVNDRKVLQAP